MNRRTFIVSSSAAVAGVAAGRLLPAYAASASAGGNLWIAADPADALVGAAPVQWAIDQLRRTLTARGFVVRTAPRLGDAGATDFCILAGGANSSFARDLGVAVPAEAESLAVAPGRLAGRDVLLASGRDVRGLVYALTEIDDAVAHADNPAAALRPARAVVEKPANSVRSAMRMFVSDVEDKGWYHDRDFWRRYLSMLVAQRFNRVNLALGLGYDQPTALIDTYFYFAYPFLLKVPGYDVRATNLSDAERDRNFEMLRFISDEAKARGLDFQLGLWTHAYEWVNSPKANHVITGLTPQTHGAYCRDALALILRECPAIGGVTMRIHGESGVPENSSDLWGTIFSGATRSGRPIGLDLHAKGMEQGTLNAAFATGLPITISPKYWAEHMGLPYHQAAIRPTELPQRERGRGLFAVSEGARSFLRYGVGDLMREDRRYSIVHRIWPGTQRLLLWGDPVFGAAYARAYSFCGSAGAELMEPLSFKGRKGSGLPGGRDGYADLSLRASGDDFEKFRYTYRLWGRQCYNPDTAPEVWQRQLRKDYGGASPAAEASLASASRILPLLTTAHLPSAANNFFWAEMPVSMPIVSGDHPEPYTDTPVPKRFGFVSPLDPQLFARVDDFAAAMVAGKVPGSYSPIEVATWLESFAQTASEQVALLPAKNRTPAVRRLAIDLEIQIGLGRFWARKLRAGVLYALYEKTADRAALDDAVAQYRAARATWAHLVEITKNVYVPDVSYGIAWYQRGNWSDRLAAIDADLKAMEQSAVSAPSQANANSPQKAAALVQQALAAAPRRATPPVAHTPPAKFKRGEPFALEISLAKVSPRPTEARLYFRQLNQAEPWRTAAMEVNGVVAKAAIPADYTDTPYALEYYFEVATAGDRPALWPGLGADLTTPPYLVVRSV
jgi:hypothetical protein